MLNPHDPLQFKTNTEAMGKSGALGKQVRRKAPADKTKEDFEKVLKRKDKKKAEDKPTLTRKSKAGQKPHQQRNLKDLDDTPTGALFGAVASKEGISETSEERIEFLQEQPDIAAVNPNAEGKSALIGKSDAVQQADQTKQVKEIVDQIVNKLYTLKQEGKTETIMTLRHPPIFEGAHLRLTSYDSARGEFNITFSQLSAEAKALLDLAMAKQDLQRKLEMAGYTAHIVVATTEKDEQVIATKESPFAQGDKERQNSEEEENPREQKEEEG